MESMLLSGINVDVEILQQSHDISDHLSSLV